MMLTLGKTLFSIGLGFIISSLLGLIFIPQIKKKKIYQKINIYVPEHNEKRNTPSFGGIIFLIPVLIIMIYQIKIKIIINFNLFLIIL